MPKLTSEQKFVRRVPYFEDKLLQPNLSMILYEQELTESHEARARAVSPKRRKNCENCGFYEVEYSLGCTLNSLGCINSLLRPRFMSKEDLENAKKGL